MSDINLDGFKVKEIRYEETDEQRKLDEIIAHLQTIVMDRTIHERSKVDIHKQLKELLRIKAITMPMPTIIVEKE